MWSSLKESRTCWIPQGASSLCDSVFPFLADLHRASEGFGGSSLVFPSHRKLDEEYKERIAALKNELRKEREQILQQVGKQRVELEQEIEKAKTEENYVRDRLALSLKVILLLGLWPASLLGIPPAKLGLRKRAGPHRAPSQDSRKFALLGHDPDTAKPLLGSRFQE